MQKLKWAILKKGDTIYHLCGKSEGFWKNDEAYRPEVNVFMVHELHFHSKNFHKYELFLGNTIVYQGTSVDDCKQYAENILKTCFK